MYINNNLRDLVYTNNLQHGFWDNIRSYEEFVKNLLAEFDETINELKNGKDPREVYYSKGNKPEGVPTELADIIIFILDYFGGSEPKINIDAHFLETPDEHYKNKEYYKQIQNKEPLEYFIEISNKCRKHIYKSIFYNMMYKNKIYTTKENKQKSVPIELHSVIKLILEFCDIYGINMNKELIDKINYNNTRPKDYRKMGQPELLETDPNKVFREMMKKGNKDYTQYEEIIRDRIETNNMVLEKRRTRRILEASER